MSAHRWKECSFFAQPTPAHTSDDRLQSPSSAALHRCRPDCPRQQLHTNTQPTYSPYEIHSHGSMDAPRHHASLGRFRCARHGPARSGPPAARIGRHTAAFDPPHRLPHPASGPPKERRPSRAQAGPCAAPTPSPQGGARKSHMPAARRRDSDMVRPGSPRAAVFWRSTTRPNRPAVQTVWIDGGVHALSESGPGVRPGRP
jgi:hypothetical protein